MRPPVFILGTGRCGTKSAAHLLSQQLGWIGLHEPRPILPWDVRTAPECVMNRVHRLQSLHPDKTVVECSLFLLPYLAQLLEHFPGSRAVVLQRDREGTAQSYVRHLRQWWSHTPVDHWRKDRSGCKSTPWDIAYPKFETTSVLEGVRLYWDAYYQRVYRLMARFPNRIDLFATDDLCYAARFLDIVGVEPYNRVIAPVWINSTRHRAAEGLTAVCKTFEREDAFTRTLKVFTAKYPEIPILVGDDSRESYAARVVQSLGVLSVTVQRLPYDSGAGLGRNLLIQQVKTPHLLLMDDDYEFGPEANVHKMMELLEEFRLDMVAGQTTKNGKPREWNACFTYDKPDILRCVPVSAQSPFTLCHLTQLFAVARTEVLQQRRGGLGPFDPDLKTSPEHLDMMLQLWQDGVRVGSTSLSSVEDRGERSPGYNVFRFDRVPESFQRMMKRRQLSKIILPNQREIVLA